jgi:hypothetical protein
MRMMHNAARRAARMTRKDLRLQQRQYQHHVLYVYPQEEERNKSSTLTKDVIKVGCFAFVVWLLYFLWIVTHN